MPASAGRNAAAVPQANAGAAQALGARLKGLRLSRRLSLRQLAEATRSSASFISQLERGLTGASTASLNQIASALGVSVGMLFEEPAAPMHGVLRRGQRPSLPASHGCHKMLLSRQPLADMEVYVGDFDIGGSTGPAPYTHGDAHEMLVVLRGAVEITLGEATHVLEEGDSIEYATSIPHRTQNIGPGRAEVMWIIAPPTSTRTELEQYLASKSPANRPAHNEAGKQRKRDP